MKKFKNRITGEILSFVDFTILVFDEAERLYHNNWHYHDNLWCNLTKEEQIELFCEQFEYQLETDWKEV